MVFDGGIAQLIESIYDAVDAEQGWMPLLKAMDEVFEAQGVHLFVRDLGRGQFIEECYSGAYPEELQIKFERLLPTDPAWPISAANPGALINDVDHYGDAYFERTPIYNEVLKWIDCRYRVTANLPISDGLVGGFAVTRAKTTGAFGDEDVGRLELLLPHIVRALRLQQRMRRLERDAHNIAAALDRLPTAAVIVSQSLQIICDNRQAEELLGSCESLRIRRGELVPKRASEATALRKAAKDAIALADSAIETPIAPPAVVAISRPEELPLEVLAVPLRPRYQLRQKTDQKARALLLLYDPATRPRIDPVLIERLFGLTPTEADVAARLAEGMSIAEIADQRQCSASTVRTHVKRVLQKTRTNRQAELVQLILTSPAISFEG